MATRPSAKPSNRQVGYGGAGNGGNPMDVGLVSINKTLREDTRWFIVGVVVLSVVLFFALPMAVLVYVDSAKLQVEIRYEMNQLKRKQAAIEKREAALRAAEEGRDDKAGKLRQPMD